MKHLQQKTKVQFSIFKQTMQQLTAEQQNTIRRSLGQVDIEGVARKRPVDNITRRAEVA